MKADYLRRNSVRCYCTPDSKMNRLITQHGGFLTCITHSGTTIFRRIYSSIDSVGTWKCDSVSRGHYCSGRITFSMISSGIVFVRLRNQPLISTNIYFLCIRFTQEFIIWLKTFKGATSQMESKSRTKAFSYNSFWTFEMFKLLLFGQFKGM